MQQIKWEADAWEYRDAFRTVRLVKNLLWWAAILSILAQLAVAAMVRYGGVLDAQYAKQATAPGPAAHHQPSGRSAETSRAEESRGASRPAAAGVAVQSDGKAPAAPDTRERALRWVLRGTKFLGLVASMLLVLTLMFAVMLSLLGRLGGTAGLMGAFFWSLILLPMLVPWQQVLQSPFACGALFNLDNLTSWTARVRASWGASSPAARDLVFYYARFLVYPAVALLVCLVIQVKFAAGLKRMALSAGTGEAPHQPSTPQQ